MEPGSKGGDFDGPFQAFLAMSFALVVIAVMSIVPVGLSVGLLLSADASSAALLFASWLTIWAAFNAPLLIVYFYAAKAASKETGRRSQTSVVMMIIALNVLIAAGFAPFVSFLLFARF
jgi:hypothetical protein